MSDDRIGLDAAVLSDEIAQKVGDQNRRQLALGRDVLGEDDERALATRIVVRQINQRSTQLIDAGQPGISPKERQDFVDRFLSNMFGFGAIDERLKLPGLTDLHVNGPDEVFGRFVDGRTERLDPVAQSDNELRHMISEFLIRKVPGREHRIDNAQPIVTAITETGQRIFAAISVTSKPTLAIRVPTLHLTTLEALERVGMLTPELTAFFTALGRVGRNVIIAGKTGSGKTTLARAIANEIPQDQRLVTVESDPELRLKSLRPEMNVVEMWERKANAEGEGEVGMKELVQKTLRMDADRVIVGETLGPETLPLLMSMTQGTTGGMATMHSESVSGCVERLKLYAALYGGDLPAEAASALVRLGVDFIVFLEEVDGRRCVVDVAEVLTEHETATSIVVNHVFELDAATRKVRFVSKLVGEDNAKALARGGFES